MSRMREGGVTMPLSAMPMHLDAEEPGEADEMELPIDLNLLTPAEHIEGDTADETAALKEMLARAVAYLKSFSWCPLITERYLGYGVGGVLALFLFRLQPAINGEDEWLWVVVGDLPSAYFVIDEARDPASALEAYCELMEDWAEAVLSKSSLDEVFPVTAAPTKKHAEMLKSRVRFIRKNILPSL